MKEKSAIDNLTKIKYGLKAVLDKYYSVQFHLIRIDSSYLSKLRNLSENGLILLIKQGFFAFKQLQVVDVPDIEYNPIQFSGHKTFKKPDHI